MANCAYPKCGKEFTPHPLHPDQKYCCSSHRASHAALRKREAKKMGMAGADPMAPPVMQAPPPAPEVVQADAVQVTVKQLPKTAQPTKIDRFDVPAGLPPHADWIVRQQDRQITKLEEENKRLVLKNDSLVEQVNTARNELSELKTNQKIREIENQKPSGLNGLFPAGIEGILNNPHVGPVIGQVLSNLLTPRAGSAQVAGTEERVPLLEWLNAQPDEVKQSFVELMEGIMKTEPEQMAATIKRLVNVLTGGSVMPKAQANVTAAYGY